MLTTAPLTRPPKVSVIIPARNEQASIEECLASLVIQSGVNFEVIVVDDHSTDCTRQIAESFRGVKVIDAGKLPDGWTGKNNALVVGARAAQGEWLLFTDADTVHLPNSVARSLSEAQEDTVDFLSYSPEQIAVTFWEMATLPVVFAELARQYPPAKVSDPGSPIAAANGQFILVRRDAYDAVGGHDSIARNILEDVALARAVKSSSRRIRFRYAPDMVRTRMYRSWPQLRDGWTKNLAALFPRPGLSTARSLLLWASPWTISSLRIAGVLKNPAWNAVAAIALILLALQINRAHFPLKMTALGTIFGIPIFAYLLLRSKRAHATGNVAWKGRKYSDRATHEDASDCKQPRLLLRTKN